MFSEEVEQPEDREWVSPPVEGVRHSTGNSAYRITSTVFISRTAAAGFLTAIREEVSPTGEDGFR